MSRTLSSSPYAVSRHTLVERARTQARALGYSVYQGQFAGTSDNRIGRFYIRHRDDDVLRPYGRGYATRDKAWIAAAWGYPP